MGAWNLPSKFLWYAESDGVIFIQIPWILGGVIPFFRKQDEFSQDRNFWWVGLNYIKLIHLKSA